MADPADVLAILEAQLPLEQAPWEGSKKDSKVPQAGVLVALTSGAQPRVLLGRRAMHLKLHPGEIAFAGGKREVEDASPWATAMREAFEEVGIEERWVTPLGELPPLFTRTGFEVHPCIASVPAQLDLVVDSGEFDSVFFTDLATFADPDVFELKEFTRGDTTMYVPHYQVEQDAVWGVTAAILAQLANVAYDAGFDLQRNWKVEP
ncbi:MAG: 8-oxo-dGTP pyrophosphatase MutT (NUDIX family) [Halioglobus sp.]|jgi:8-oxo-dGTP pyrophosphatase MutT (NUDIX family)